MLIVPFAAAERQPHFIGFCRDRHRNNGCNNLFFDGHVEWLKAEDNTSFYWCGTWAP
jgi:prepilin-type processing-associated H-X9-DG protein